MRDVIAKLYWDGANREFNDLFMQLYVSRDNKINIPLLNKFLESDLTYKQLTDIILDISGSKFIEFRHIAEFNVATEDMFHSIYQFGQFESGVEWIQEIYELTGEVLPRCEVLGWIADQYPRKAASSFAPVGMAHHDYRANDED